MILGRRSLPVNGGGADLPLDAFEGRIAHAERALMLVIFAAAALLQLNGVLHHGFMGQDWSYHAANAALAAQRPPPRWIVYVGTNPPGLYWLSAFVHYATGTTAYIAATSFVVVVLNLVALWGWKRLAKEAIGRPSLRVAALITLAFIPFRVIHSTVFAADAMAVLPFTLMPWLFHELFRVTESRRQYGLIVAVCIVLLLGIASKYTMASAVPVALGLVLVLRRKLASRQVLLGALVLVVLVPGLFALQQHYVYSHLPTGPGQQEWAHDMSWRSLVMFHRADVDVLRAPSYAERISLHGAEVYNLLENNRHSYPALLHLSMFTDPMNIYQSDPSDSYFGARDSLHQALMTVAVNFAIPLSVLMVVATGVYLFRALSSLRRFDAFSSSRPLLTTIVVGFSAAFFANIAVFLPLVRYAYYYGYWQARLVMPALLGFCLLGFVLLDERLRSRAARAAVLVYAVAQAALHVSFLWVRGP
jgi:hypothetical protein